MPLFSIKSNPFDDEYAKRWTGVGKRAEEAVAVAQQEAQEVLREEIVARGARSGLSGELLDAVQPMGSQVGIPTGPLAQEGFEEEFGTLTKRPKGIMRSAERSARKRAEETFAEVLHEELFG